MERDPDADLQRIRRRLQGNLFVDSGAVDDEEIDTVIDDAYYDNLANGRVVKPEFVDDIATNALKDQIEHVVEEQEEERSEWQGLEAIGDAKLEGILLDEFASTEKVLKRENNVVRMPTPEDFDSVGVDFKELMEEFAEMDAKDMGPMIILSPVNMNSARWRQIFTSLTKDQSIPNNPLKEHQNYRTGHKHGLDIPSFPNDHTWQEIREDAKKQLIMRMQQPVPVVNVIQDPDNPSFDVLWTIRILPTTDLSVHARPYPTIDEYLTMQARLVQDGRGVLMGRYRLAGVAREASAYHQPFGEWNAAEGCVEISATRFSNR